MPYLLRHYFDPDFNHQNLVPRSVAGGDSDYFYLGYVQNVVAGQVLAEITSVDENPDTDGNYPRFVYADRHMPCGPNSAIHPGNPDRIIATSNGYVFYYKDLITVKKLLNIRGDVDFHTGNILFVGDVAVHGSIKAGFSIKANNVQVKGPVEGGTIKAQGDITCEAGVRGSSNSILRAGGNVHINFCENTQIRAGGNVVISGSCMHSTIFVGGTLIVKGRLVGGIVYANNTVYIEEQLGSDKESPTSILMGYDPFEDLYLRELDNNQVSLRKVYQQHKALLAKADQSDLPELENKMHLIKGKRDLVKQRRHALWEKFSADENREQRCRVIVPGRVNPGVEIAIGPVGTRVDYATRDIEFRLREDEIITQKTQL